MTYLSAIGCLTKNEELTKHKFITVLIQDLTHLRKVLQFFTTIFIIEVFRKMGNSAAKPLDGVFKNGVAVALSSAHQKRPVSSNYVLVDVLIHNSTSIDRYYNPWVLEPVIKNSMFWEVSRISGPNGEIIEKIPCGAVFVGECLLLAMVIIKLIFSKCFFIFILR